MAEEEKKHEPRIIKDIKYYCNLKNLKGNWKYYVIAILIFTAFLWLPLFERESSCDPFEMEDDEYNKCIIKLEKNK